MTAATIKETTTLPTTGFAFLYEACVGVGFGSLVFTALLWKNVATASMEVRHFIKSRGAVFTPGAVFLGPRVISSQTPRSIRICDLHPIFPKYKRTVR